MAVDLNQLAAFEDGLNGLLIKYTPGLPVELTDLINELFDEIDHQRETA